MPATPAQLNALRLATVDALRYYKGGWISVPVEAGAAPMGQYAVRGQFEGRFTATITVRACVAAGWLDDNGASDIYARRWALTDAGKAEVIIADAFANRVRP